jgi:hypothetical protein
VPVATGSVRALDLDLFADGQGTCAALSTVVVMIVSEPSVASPRTTASLRLERFAGATLLGGAVRSD